MADSQDVVSEEQTDSGSSAMHSTALSRFKRGQEAWDPIFKLAEEDVKFSIGEQWPEEIKREREADGRPCLTINRQPQFIHQVTNDQRQNRPALKVYPADDKADVDTAEILQGVLRHIEYDSNADAAYDTAFDGSVRRSFGAWRLITDYVSPTSFNQEIKFKRIRNPQSVIIDPDSKESDGSDMNWAFIVDEISREEFEELYPDAEIPKNDKFELEGVQAGWCDKDKVRIAEYYYKEFKDDVLYLLSNGETILESVAESDDFVFAENITIVDERPTKTIVVKWAKLTGFETLEETELPGTHIPVFPVYGEEVDVNGERKLISLIRDSKDSQRMYNYNKSTEAETIALAPRSPFIAAEGQIPKEYESMWVNANRKSFPFLVYKPTTHENQLVPPPQRQSVEPAIQAVTQAGMLASEDIKATTGIYDAALGQKSNENSGIAIQRRNVQAQTSNFHFVDNLTRTIKHCGKVLVEWIPLIYDTERVIKIIGEDGEQEVVRVNAFFEKYGKRTMYDLTAGKYDVTVDVGPSFQTKRQEALASMIEVSKANPMIWQAAGDLMIKSMDWNGAQEIADRFKKTMNPAVVQDEKSMEIPPQVAAQIAQMEQLMKQQAELIQQAQLREQMKVLDLQSKERIEFAKMEVDLKKEVLKQSGANAQFMVEQEAAELQMRQNMVGINQPITTNPNLNGAGPQGSAMPNQNQQPTGGQPCPYMGV